MPVLKQVSPWQARLGPLSPRTDTHTHPQPSKGLGTTSGRDTLPPAKTWEGGEGEAVGEGGVGDPLLHQERCANTHLPEKIERLEGGKQRGEPLCRNALNAETSSEEGSELWRYVFFLK